VSKSRLDTHITFGHQLILYVSFSVITITFLLLQDYDKDTEFKGNLIFFLTLIGSFVFLYAFSFTDIYQRKLGVHGAVLFFMQDLPIRKFIIYVPMGIGASLLMSIVSQNLGLDATNSSLVSIAGAGTVMMIAFFLTKSIVVPILIHGAFNTLVIALRDGILTSVGATNALFPVPDVGITVGGFNQFATDALIQFTLVAPAEEMMKMLVIFFVVLGIPNAKFSDGIAKYVGAFFALLIWTMFHAIIAV